MASDEFTLHADEQGGVRLDGFGGVFRLRGGGDRRWLDVELPGVVHEEIEREALRIDTGPSGLLNWVWRAYAAVSPHPELARRAARAEIALTGEPVGKRYILHATDADVLESMSNAAGETTARMLLRAWCALRDDVKRLPSVNELV